MNCISPMWSLRTFGCVSCDVYTFSVGHTAYIRFASCSHDTSAFLIVPSSRTSETRTLENKACPAAKCASARSWNMFSAQRQTRVRIRRGASLTMNWDECLGQSTDVLASIPVSSSLVAAGRILESVMSSSDARFAQQPDRSYKVFSIPCVCPASRHV